MALSSSQRNFSKHPPTPARSSSSRLKAKYQEELTPQEVVARLTEWEENHAKEIFHAYDYDNSGSINRTELQEMLTEQQWVLDTRALDDFIEKHVGDGLEEVDYKTFLQIYGAMLERQPTTVRRKREKGNISVEDMYELEQSTRRVFESMDADGTGYLDEGEMREVMREAGLPDTDGDNYETVVVENMRIYDKNQDGQISFEEFVLYRNAVLDNFFRQSQAQGTPDYAGNAVDPEGDPWAESLFAS